MNRPAPFRLAIRADGSMINAYLARPDSMQDAHLIACVSRAAAAADPMLFDAFKALAVQALRAIVGSALGVTMEVAEERAAPEHERAGHA